MTNTTPTQMLFNNAAVYLKNQNPENPDAISIFQISEVLAIALCTTKEKIVAKIIQALTLSSKITLGKPSELIMETTKEKNLICRMEDYFYKNSLDFSLIQGIFVDKIINNYYSQLSINELNDKKYQLEEKEIHTILFEICNHVHASCNKECPVYVLQSEAEKDSNYCPCFKDGKAMSKFIEERLK